MPIFSCPFLQIVELYSRYSEGNGVGSNRSIDFVSTQSLKITLLLSLHFLLDLGLIHVRAFNPRIIRQSVRWENAGRPDKKNFVNIQVAAVLLGQHGVEAVDFLPLGRERVGVAECTQTLLLKPCHSVLLSTCLAHEQLVKPGDEEAPLAFLLNLLMVSIYDMRQKCQRTCCWKAGWCTC